MRPNGASLKVFSALRAQEATSTCGSKVECLGSVIALVVTARSSAGRAGHLVVIEVNSECALWDGPLDPGILGNPGTQSATSIRKLLARPAIAVGAVGKRLFNGKTAVFFGLFDQVESAVVICGVAGKDICCHNYLTINIGRYTGFSSCKQVTFALAAMTLLRICRAGNTPRGGALLYLTSLYDAIRVDDVLDILKQEQAQ